MMRRASLFCVVMGFSCGGAIAAEKPFYGKWSCAMVADNAVNVQDWLQETYSDAGVTLGSDGKAEKLKIKLIRKNVYELTYGGGARGRLVMKEPWMFMRGTPEHSYICLRKAS
ncbi:hypothetical protein [Methylocystis echinoides]|nr:hypothetical protein [Methylocystis echinoides]